MGRPPKVELTEKIQSAIVDGILEGKPITHILNEFGINECTFYRFRLRNPEFDGSIARAQEMTQEREVDAMLQIADSANEENANAMKLRIWTRMWIAGKRKPKKYGDKIQQEHTGENGGPIQIVSTIPRPPKE